jgi:hypothetical protein
MPSLEGAALPQAQSSTVELAPALFVRARTARPHASRPFSGIEFTQDVAADTFAPALTIRDVTTAAEQAGRKDDTQTGGT